MLFWRESYITHTMEQLFQGDHYISVCVFYWFFHSCKSSLSFLNLIIFELRVFLWIWKLERGVCWSFYNWGVGWSISSVTNSFGQWALVAFLFCWWLWQGTCGCLVEQRTENPGVTSSNLVPDTRVICMSVYITN